MASLYRLYFCWICSLYVPNSAGKSVLCVQSASWYLWYLGNGGSVSDWMVSAYATPQQPFLICVWVWLMDKLSGNRMIGWSFTCRCRGMTVLSKQMELILCRVWIQVEINWLQHHILLAFMLLFGPTASILDLSVYEFFTVSSVLLLSHWHWSLWQRKKWNFQYQWCLILTSEITPSDLIDIGPLLYMSSKVNGQL